MNGLKARATPFLVRPRQCLGLGTAALAVALMAPADGIRLGTGQRQPASGKCGCSK